jgi:hypothetical protein
MHPPLEPQEPKEPKAEISEPETAAGPELAPKTSLKDGPEIQAAPKAKPSEKVKKPEKKPEAQRKVKERDQRKFYRDAEATAISLLTSPVPERDYIDSLKKNIELLTHKQAGAQKGKPANSASEAEEIRNLLRDKFADSHFEENKWKYPIVYGDRKYTSYSYYEIATFVTSISGKAKKDKNAIASMANDGFLNIIVDRLNELYKNSRT